MAQFGSDKNAISQSFVGVTDENGNSIVSTAVDFSASPLGIAARAQALFGIPNAQFNLLPPDTSAQIEDNENPLPYWSADNLSTGRITAYSVFDTATSTWGVQLNPSAGSANDSITLKTRSYLLNDDNLSLRQKAFLTLAKSGTAAGTTQFNVVMTAEYFDANDTSLSGGTAYAIGTALDTATFTTINGFTTSGSSAIGASAAYADIKVTLTCSADVTGSAQATLKSMLLQTSTGGGGGGLIIVETFTSSATFTRPTGVDYLLGIVGSGGGGGGASGSIRGTTSTSNLSVYLNSATGGGGGGYGIARNVYIGTIGSTVSIGVGAGGAGGDGVSYARGTVAVASLVGVNTVGTAGATGGNSTFGTIFTATGGSGGTPCVVTTSPAVPGVGQGGSVTPVYYDGTFTNGGGGGTAGTGFVEAGTNRGVVVVGVRSNPTGGVTTNSLPYQSALPGVGGVGGTGSISATGVAGSTYIGAAGSAILTDGNIGWGGATSSAIGVNFGALATAFVYASGTGLNGAGGAGASSYFRLGNGTAFGTYVVTGGDGGTAAANSGAGGAAGGHAFLDYSTSGGASTAYARGSVGINSGDGQAGAAGFITVAYVA